MPVIPQVNEGFKIGLNYTAMAPPQFVGIIKGTADGVMNGMGLIPAGPIMIPVIPFGIAISVIMNMVDAMENQGDNEQNKINGKLLGDYQKRLEKAQAQRKKAVEELYETLKTAKKEKVDRYNEIVSEIESNTKTIAELEVEYDTQFAEYMATITPMAGKAKAANELGNEEEANMWKDKIAVYDPWFEDIMKMMIDMAQLRLDNIILEMEKKPLEPFLPIPIKKEWPYMNQIAMYPFFVPVPYYPDLPDKPNIPPTVNAAAKTQGPGQCWQRKLKQAFFKWLSAPMVPPAGLAVNAGLELIRCLTPKLPPPLAAGMEAGADQLKTMAGGII